jgi:hypothetical protein
VKRKPVGFRDLPVRCCPWYGRTFTPATGTCFATPGSRRGSGGNTHSRRTKTSPSQHRIGTGPINRNTIAPLEAEALRVPVLRCLADCPLRNRLDRRDLLQRLGKREDKGGFGEPSPRDKQEQGLRRAGRRLQRKGVREGDAHHTICGYIL